MAVNKSQKTKHEKLLVAVKQQTQPSSCKSKERDSIMFVSIVWFLVDGLMKEKLEFRNRC